MAEKDTDRPGPWFVTALAVIVGAIALPAFFRDDPPATLPAPQNRRITPGVIFKVLVEGLTVLLLAITAKIQYDSFIVQQGRPFLTVQFEEIRSPASGEKVQGLDAVEWVYSIKNSGNAPAFNVKSYCLAAISGKPRFGININGLPSSARIEDIPKSSIDDKSGEEIVPAQGTGRRTFLMPMIFYQELLNSSRKIEDGVAFRIEYAGPWNKKWTRPYFFQTRMIPWRDGKFIRIKINQSSGN
jgi:hypothetical protein